MPSILIVENEAIVATDLANKLQRLGYDIAGTVWRGEDAVGLARERRPDLILMDIRLAGAMDGIEAANQIRTECDLPVIYLTAHSDRATLSRAKVTEPFGYILKPFEERDIESHIEMALYKHQTERKLRASEERLRQFNVELEQRVIERTEQLRALTAELTLAEERERRRIAGILHDRLHPLLVGARLQVEAALASPAASSRHKCLDRACELLDQSAGVSHDLTHELSPPSLHDFGLAEAIRWLGGWMGRQYGLNVQLDAADGPPIPDDFKLLLFHSVRELLLNVVQHAGVKSASVSLARENGKQIELIVRDQGKGFDVEKIARYAGGHGIGLFGIRERLQRLGGRMEIESNPDRGSQVRLIAPL
jgi:signal transduction histidine kinase